MARKLLIIMALISLVLVTQAPVSLATTYELTSVDYLGDINHPTWRHSYPDALPWTAGAEFIAGAPILDASIGEATWKIGNFVSSPIQEFQPYYSSGGVENSDGSYTITFNTTSATPNFFIVLPDNTTISSNDTVITYNVTYTYSDRYTVNPGEIIGVGTNSSDHTPFYFIADLFDDEGNHKNQGHLTSFTVHYGEIYSGEISAAQTPIPGAVWLLGTGLLGLGLVGRRRKS